MEQIVVWAMMAIGVFFIARELFCWYWKVNRIVELLESIDKKLKRLDKAEEKEVQSVAPVETADKKVV